MKAGIFILIFFALVPVVSAEYRVHMDYDWEGDDASEQAPQPKFESCFPCHREEHGAPVKVCEDCHLPDGAGPYRSGTDFTLRPDYEVPVVYEHYYGAEDVNVRNQSFGVAMSTCFSIDPITGGTCHGVSYVRRDGAGGYFAFNENWTGEYRDRDPYEYTSPSSYLPDTADCLFCHDQDDGGIRYTWGDAPQVNSTHSKIANKECYRCHVEKGVKPASFHSQALYLVEEEESAGGAEPEPVSDNRIVTAGLILAILALAVYLFGRAKSGQK